MCFDMRLDRTALYAFEHGFPAFTTTNATSRWKDQHQVNGSGLRAAGKYDGVEYWVYDWQTDQMTQRNSALVEETSASARTLADLSRRLGGIVGFFRLSHS